MIDFDFEDASFLSSSVINQLDVNSDATVDCFTCGKPISLSMSSRHILKCYRKQELLVTLAAPYKSSGGIYCDHLISSNPETYCKRLKAICFEHGNPLQRLSGDVCGFPLSWETGNHEMLEDDHCKKPSKSCVPHFGWQFFRIALIDHDRIRLWKAIEEAKEEIMCAERNKKLPQSVLSLLQHDVVRN